MTQSLWIFVTPLKIWNVESHTVDLGLKTGPEFIKLVSKQVRLLTVPNKSEIKYFL